MRLRHPPSVSLPLPLSLSLSRTHSLACFSSPTLLWCSRSRDPRETHAGKRRRIREKVEELVAFWCGTRVAPRLPRLARRGVSDCTFAPLSLDSAALLWHPFSRESRFQTDWRRLEIRFHWRETPLLLSLASSEECMCMRRRKCLCCLREKARIACHSSDARLPIKGSECISS